MFSHSPESLFFKIVLTNQSTRCLIRFLIKANVFNGAVIIEMVTNVYWSMKYIPR